MNWRLFITMVGAALMSGCMSGVPVSIENQSASDLTNVVVSGKGFSESVGTIRAGARETVHVRPKGESGIKVTFEADGQRYHGIEDGYIENDDLYTVKITVDASFSVAIETNLR